jgi:hypothetical protein
MTATHTYSIDDYDADVGNLHHLLAAAMEVLLELDYGRGRTRNHGLDRAAALVHIARDMAERILEQRGLHYEARPSGNVVPVESGARP